MLGWYLLMIAGVAAAVEVTIFYPDLDPGVSATVSIIGAGTDQRTTYAVVPAPTDTVRQTLTFIEGPSDFVIPSQGITTEGGVASLYLSCGIKGGQADCHETVVENGTTNGGNIKVTATSAVFQAVGQTNLISSSAPSPQNTGASTSIFIPSRVFGLSAFLAAVSLW